MKQAIIAPAMDTRTLIIVLFAQVSLLAVLAIYFGSRQQGTLAVGTWGTGLLVTAAGLCCLALRGLVPDLVSITLANALTLGANLLFYRAFRIIDGKPLNDPLGFGTLFVTVALIFYFSEIVPDFPARVVIISFASALFFARNTIELGSEVAAEVRASRRFMQSIYAVLTAILVVRTVANAYSPPTDMLVPNAEQTAYILAVMMLVIAGSFGMFWMEIQYLHLELARQAARDPLTGMLNRRAFLSEFERELARVRRGGSVLSIAMLDLDHFKALNDAHGHPAGDEVLRNTARIMQDAIRRPDFIARYGGEEFALLMPDTDADMAMRVVERIRAAVQSNGIEWEGQRLSVTLSAGVAAFPSHGKAADALVAAADAALYEAKRAGRNRALAAAGRGEAVEIPIGIHATS